MTKIILTRHGHVEGTDPPRFRGHADVPLTAFGRAEANAVADRIAGNWSPSAVYTSPLQRCVATGARIAEACGCRTETLPNIIDLDYGELQWKTHEEAQAQFPDLVQKWFSTPQLVRFPGGESLQDVVSRTANALRTVLARHRDSLLVMVGHDNVNRALLLQLLDQPLSAFWRVAQSHCGISEIGIDGQEVRIARINETAHLESLAGR
jgi:broad specificity phosphatase PhoE